MSMAAIFIASMVLFPKVVPSEEKKEAASPAYVGSDQCLTCHENLDASIMRTKHRTLFADSKKTGPKKGCEGCHGAGAAHLEDPEAGVLRFGKAAPDKVAAACLKCHLNDGMRNWKLGEHISAGISCNKCHVIHEKATDKTGKSKNSTPHLLADNPPDLCLSCHAKHAADLDMPSRHPIKEGKVSCSSCHSPHDTSPMAMENSKSACLKCHAEKAGPYLFEHEPVSDSCTNCHAPHGSVNQNLLTLRQPSLCFQCHTVALNIPAHDPKGNSTFKKCTGCHQNIHGSNSTQGDTFQQ